MENIEISKITFKEFFSTPKWMSGIMLSSTPNEQHSNFAKENYNSENLYNDSITQAKKTSPYPAFISKSNKNINLIGYMDFDPKLAASTSYSSRRNGRQISQQPWFHN